jgi:hypothetical protein
LRLFQRLCLRVQDVDKKQQQQQQQEPGQVVRVVGATAEDDG